MVDLDNLTEAEAQQVMELLNLYGMDEISSNRKGKIVDGEEQELPF